MQALEKVLSRYDCRNAPRAHVYHNHVHQHHVHQQRGNQHPGHQQNEDEYEQYQLWRNNLVREHRDEDYLPNSLEDFLAIQGTHTHTEYSLSVLNGLCTSASISKFTLLEVAPYGHTYTHTHTHTFILDL